MNWIDGVPTEDGIYLHHVGVEGGEMQMVMVDSGKIIFSNSTWLPSNQPIAGYLFGPIPVPPIPARPSSDEGEAA